MKDIGGYFSLELNIFNNMPHMEGLLLNSGRNALEYVLRSIGKINCLYIPYFTCDVVLEPVEKLAIKYKFYSINENLEISDKIQLSEGEYIIYTNYFGIKDGYIADLNKVYGDQLIVDNAQALYASKTLKCAYSPRKFVGIPDGGIAFTNGDSVNFETESDISSDRCEHLLIRLDQGASAGYQKFRENSGKLKQQPIRKMSSLTKSLIGNTDFLAIKEKRIRNFNYLHQYLKSSNLLEIPKDNSYACPMVYPFWVENGLALKKKLIENKIFVATYWPNVLEWCTENMLERNITEKLLPLPIDQRYDTEDMNFILSFL